MDVVASPAAVALVRERGGQLYVWRTRRSRGCAGMAFLRTAAEPPQGVEFTRVPFEPFELHLGAMPTLPAELRLETRKQRVKAYWDGCAWVI